MTSSPTRLTLTWLMMLPLILGGCGDEPQAPASDAGEAAEMLSESEAREHLDAFTRELFPGSIKETPGVNDKIQCDWTATVTAPDSRAGAYQAQLQGTLRTLLEQTMIWTEPEDLPTEEQAETEPTRKPKSENLNEAPLYPLPGAPTTVQLDFESADGIAWYPVDWDWVKQVGELCGDDEAIGNAAEKDTPVFQPPNAVPVAAAQLNCDQTWREFRRDINLYSSAHHALSAHHIEDQPLNDQEDRCVGMSFSNACIPYTRHGARVTTIWEARCVPRAQGNAQICWADTRIPEEAHRPAYTQGAADHKHRGHLLWDSCAFNKIDGRTKYADTCTVHAHANFTRRDKPLGQEVGIGASYSATHSETPPKAAPIVAWGGVGVIVNVGAGNVADYYRAKGYVASMRCNSRGRPVVASFQKTSQSASEPLTR